MPAHRQVRGSKNNEVEHDVSVVPHVSDHRFPGDLGSVGLPSEKAVAQSPPGLCDRRCR